jgi:hypothetical protein
MATALISASGAVSVSKLKFQLLFRDEQWFPASHKRPTEAA